MQTVKLNNGVDMPILGLGLFQVTERAECEGVVLDAIAAGYRLIDTAAAYGNEEAVGAAIKACGVPREELFITTKLWAQDAGYENTIKAFKESLEKLQLDYLDLYLIHAAAGDYYGSWRAMEQLYKEGKIRAIGVSNFSPYHLVDLILNNQVVPAINQVETNPFSQQADAKKVMEEYGVQIESWGPFAQGQKNIYQNELLTGIGAKYNKTVAQVILRWHIQRGVVAIPKSVRKERLVENFSVWDFALSEEDMLAIATMETGTADLFTADAAKMIHGWKIHE